MDQSNSLIAGDNNPMPMGLPDMQAPSSGRTVSLEKGSGIPDAFSVGRPEYMDVSYREIEPGPATVYQEQPGFNQEQPVQQTGPQQMYQGYGPSYQQEPAAYPPPYAYPQQQQYPQQPYPQQYPQQGYQQAGYMQPYPQQPYPQQQPTYAAYPPQQKMVAPSVATKFCKHCGNIIPADAVICTGCGRQVEELSSSQTQVVINNTNDNHVAPVNTVTNVAYETMPVMAEVTLPIGRRKSKWTAFLLCLFLGTIGVHRFYEGKIGTGLLYLFTGGLLGIGWIVDLIILLGKPDPYYV